MKIGFDFDNTIVSYDTLFHKVASQLGLISQECPKDKNSVKESIFKSFHESVWTELQGLVYGQYMPYADIYPGVTDCLMELKSRGYNLCIISHKTRFPYLGPKYDLIEAAKLWINNHLQSGSQLFLNQQSVFFEPSKLEKISRIEKEKCDVFVDDLEDIFAAELFPKNVEKILFAPASTGTSHSNLSIKTAGKWSQIADMIIHSKG